MKTDTFTKELLIFRNVDEYNYRPIQIYLVDKNPDGDSGGKWNDVEKIRISKEETTIMVYDLDRPVYYELPDGTRRKIHYVKKK